jgi:polar amino acid transport system permease protein
MFEFCADPKLLEGLSWVVCYMTTLKHQGMYWSVLTVLLLIGLVAPLALFLGFTGAWLKRARFVPFRFLGWFYTSTVRGVPELLFFLFVPIALDQLVELVRHKIKCPDWDQPIYQGNDFVVCTAAKIPLGASEAWVHSTWNFSLAVFAFAFVFGAFAANIIDGALKSVPKSQLETAEAYGMSKRQIFSRVHLPQMWVYALPGLSNLWQVLVKGTPLLFLLGIQDIVYWARELGGHKTSVYDYPHPDIRIWYFLALLVFYLGFTWISQIGFDRLTRIVSRGQATMGGDAAAGARA